MTIYNPLQTANVYGFKSRNSRTPVCPVPQAARIQLDFTAAQNYEFNGTMQQLRDYVDEPQGLYVDNSGNGQILTITVQATGQTITVPSASQGFFPLFAPAPTKLYFSSTGSVILNVWITNFELPAFVWNQGGGSVVSDTGLYALWNAAVAGTGPLYVRDAILEGTVVSGKVQVQDAALEAVVSGGKVQVADAILDATVSGGRVLTTDSNTGAIATNTSNTATSTAAVAALISGGKLAVTDGTLDAIVSGGKLPVTDAVLEGTVISSGTNQLSINGEGSRATYGAVCAGPVGGAAGVAVSIQGVAGKTVRIKRIRVSATFTAATNFALFVERATAISGGTSTAAPVGKFSIADPAASATITQYSVTPTTVTGAVSIDRIDGGAPAASTFMFQFEYCRGYDKPIIVSGTGDFVAVGLSPMPTSSTTITVEWEEI